MKKLFLFDMDGTLTPARKKMDHSILMKLSQLQKNNWDIGIISGSDMDYVEQQCHIMFDISPINCHSVHFLPCNGTKYYKNFKKVWAYSMAAEIGDKAMYKLMKELIYAQQVLMATYPDIPLTGNFIQVRGSVLNWCPIGRNANHDQRQKWIDIDEEKYAREYFLNYLKEKIRSDKITIKLGGETSFDIYPKGWNKTFPIEKIPFTAYNKIYFAGDRCYENGNDEALFNYLNQKENCRGIQVNSPKETIQIIDKILKQDNNHE
jgi:phosphomannomutase